MESMGISTGELAMGANGVMAVLLYFMRSAIGERDRRIAALEATVSAHGERIQAAEIKSAGSDAKIDAIFRVLERIERVVEGIQQRLGDGAE